MNSDALLRCQDLCKTASLADGDLSLLQGVSLSIGRGESVAIVGESGAGKSTLLGLLAGLDLPSSGHIWLAGQLLTEMDEEARARVRSRSVGFVFQSFQLLPGLTALENVMLPLELKSGFAGKMSDLAREQLQRVGLDARTGHYPRQLSGGEQQRVALARAFVTAPELLFADEPTGNLDAGTGSRVMDLLFALNADSATTLVLVTHNPELAGRCDRQLRLKAGKLVS